MHRRRRGPDSGSSLRVSVYLRSVVSFFILSELCSFCCQNTEHVHTPATGIQVFGPTLGPVEKETQGLVHGPSASFPLFLFFLEATAWVFVAVAVLCSLQAILWASLDLREAVTAPQPPLTLPAPGIPREVTLSSCFCEEAMGSFSFPQEPRMCCPPADPSALGKARGRAAREAFPAQPVPAALSRASRAGRRGGCPSASLRPLA